MGRQPELNQANRAKGPAGTGKSRKRDGKIRKRSAKDAHEQLAALRNKGKKGKKRNVAPAASGADGGDEGGSEGKDKDDSGSGDGDEGVRKNMRKKKKRAGGEAADGGNSGGFEKAYTPEVVEATPFPRCFWKGPVPEVGEPSDELKLRRKNIGIKVRGSPTPPPIEALSDPGMPASFRQLFCGKRQGGLGLEKPTPIQAQVWPAALSGLDLIGIAPTGSGKTLAYLMPAIPHVLGQQAASQAAAPHGTVNPKGSGVVFLALVPTRELAKQVSDSTGGSSSGGWLKRLFGLRCAAVYGGMGKEMQLDTIVTLGTPQFLVATPGRLLDLLGLGIISLASVTYLVLDEGDRMLALGFEPQLSAIMKSVRPNRQLLLFSATFPGKLREAAELWMAPERVVIRVAAVELNKGAEGGNDADDDEDDGGNVAGVGGAKGAEGEAAEGRVAAVGSGGRSTLTASKTIHQSVEYCPEHKRAQRLVRFLRRLRRKERQEGRRQRAAVLIFCSQIKTLRTLEKVLNKHGERSAALHSGLPQAKREQSLVDLKNGTVDTLVATDVASRGLHINRLKYVVNYEFPSTIEVYCHRIGRVGRSGAEGWAYSFLDKSQAPLAKGLAALLMGCGQPSNASVDALAAGREVTPGCDSESSEGEDGQQELRTGAFVRIHGLQGAKELNGMRARARKEVPGAGRWEVVLDSGEVKAVKPENLKVLSRIDGAGATGAGRATGAAAATAGAAADAAGANQQGPGKGGEAAAAMVEEVEDDAENDEIEDADSDEEAIAGRKKAKGKRKKGRPQANGSSNQPKVAKKKNKSRPSKKDRKRAKAAAKPTAGAAGGRAAQTFAAKR